MVTQTVTNNSAEGCETVLGATLPKLEKPRVVRLVDGFGVSYAYFQERKKTASEYVSSCTRELFDKLAEAAKASQ